MEKIYYNGIIKTLDSKDSIKEAIGVKNGRICFVGSNEEAEKIECKERIDLKGRLMLPGFVDGHLHMVNYAFVENSVKLFDCKNSKEIMTLVRERLDSNPDLQWMYCRGWNENNFDDKLYPTKQELDEISREIPIIVVRVCGHIAITNTCGLERLKRLSQFGEIKNEVNEDLGIIKENAVQFYYSILDKPKQELVEKYIKLGMKRLNEKGITGIQSDDFSSLPGKDWQLIMNSFNAVQTRGEMTVRVYEQCLFERTEDYREFLKLGYRTGQGGEYFKVGPLKLIQDGSLGAKTAALLEPYENDENNRGIVTMTQEQLDEVIGLAIKNNMQVAVHCIGDRAMVMVMEALEKAEKLYGTKDRRNGIVHAQITNQGILERMAKNNLVAYIQPVFVGSDMDVVESRIGKKRMDKIYAWNTMEKLGITTVGGSDAPVESFDILENIYYAVTRKNMKHLPEGGWLPEECLTVEQAVKLFTKNSSYSAFAQEANGTLEVGKNADMVILDKNIYEINPMEIKDVNVEETIIGGKSVYSHSQK